MLFFHVLQGGSFPGEIPPWPVEGPVNGRSAISVLDGQKEHLLNM